MAVWGVCLVYVKKQQWRDARRTLESAGPTIRQDAETEGTATFDPTDIAQAEPVLERPLISLRTL